MPRHRSDVQPIIVCDVGSKCRTPSKSCSRAYRVLTPPSSGGTRYCSQHESQICLHLTRENSLIIRHTDPCTLTATFSFIISKLTYKCSYMTYRCCYLSYKCENRYKSYLQIRIYMRLFEHQHSLKISHSYICVYNVLS